MEKENEFEKMYGAEDAFNGDDFENDSVEVNEQPTDADDLIASGSSGLEYDFSKASKTTKGPDRINMDGQTVTITDAKIILPKPESDWQLSKQKTVRYKPCQFILFYDNEGQREYYSGVKVFEREDKGVKKYSEPVIQNNADTQASELKKAYATYKNKKPEEISMNEFLSFLLTKPKALLVSKEFKYDNKVTNKNIVVKFI